LEEQLKAKDKKKKPKEIEEIQKVKVEIKKLKQELSQEEKENQNKSGYEADDLEIIEIYVAQERDIEVGDKLTTRFGNKGIVGKIVPEIDMPFDQEGKTIDIILNPLSVPSRMNIGQLVESFLGLIAYKLKTKLLLRPFNILD
jgi:DNA-directed RNA polymerase subunit beta